MTFSFSKMYGYITFSRAIDSGKRLFVFDVLNLANFTKNYRLQRAKTGAEHKRSLILRKEF